MYSQFFFLVSCHFRKSNPAWLFFFLFFLFVSQLFVYHFFPVVRNLLFSKNDTIKTGINRELHRLFIYRRPSLNHLGTAGFFFFSVIRRFSKKRSCFFLILSLFLFLFHFILFYFILFYFFFHSFFGAIYLFHRPMVTKPISVTRSNGRLSRCTKSAAARETNKILRESAGARRATKKTSLDPRHFAWKNAIFLFFAQNVKRRFNHNFLSLCPARTKSPFSFDEWTTLFIFISPVLRLQLQTIRGTFHIVNNYWKSIGL